MKNCKNILTKNRGYADTLKSVFVNLRANMEEKFLKKLQNFDICQNKPTMKRST